MEKMEKKIKTNVLLPMREVQSSFMTINLEDVWLKPGDFSDSSAVVKKKAELLQAKLKREMK